jgi:hypothetical protein
MKLPTIKPCPFCKKTSPEIHDGLTNGLLFAYVECPKCGLRGPTIQREPVWTVWEMKLDAVKTWNNLRYSYIYKEGYK